MVGKRVFILGSGDIGLIMARRMMLEGAEVLGVAEIMPYSNGLARNIKQCLEDFNIPLYLSHTITHIYGKDRVEGIDVCKVDEHMRPIEDEKMHFDVDTVLLSIGLIPENHLADSIQIQMDPKIKGPVVDENFMTSVPGIFAAGNGLHVHDLADYAAKQGNKAAEGCVRYLKQTSQDNAYVNTNAQKLIDEFMPGMITLVLKKKSILSDDFTAGLKTIGIRIPDDPFVLELLKRVGPMLVTSANISGQETLLNDLDVYHEFNGKLKMIVKGKCQNTLASTVVKIDDDVTILRQGCISEEKIREVLK